MSDGAKNEAAESVQSYEMPSRKAILQYLVRMGSFTSAPKIPNDDNGDLDIIVPSASTWEELQMLCEYQLAGWPPSLLRTFVTIGDQGTDTIRIMQWNILAQALAEGCDNFVNCPPAAISWESRRWRILAEVTAVQPDILCLQEVDHFRFFERVFASVGFTGVFCPKPDSPCLYIPGNNGPDGCALFVNTNRYEIMETRTRCLEVWGCQSNQVAILCKLRQRSDNTELWIGTTHLKARAGTFLTALRHEQGADLIDFIESAVGDQTPLLLAGDMNAPPEEPVHSLLHAAGLTNAYHYLGPAYTTWAVREDGEHCSVLDYILYKQELFHVERLLQVPSEQDIGPNRVPSLRYPSDHFALVSDLVLH